jgi:formate hydrogenlyase subunit 4
MSPAMVILQKIIGGTLIALLSIVIGLVFKGIDRKIHARMQGRIGPPIWQPFWDLRKLMIKDSMVPENAVVWLFNAAPLIGLAATITILFYLPIGGLTPIAEGTGDLVLILYLMTLPAVMMVLGGFASGSPFAIIGAQREMVMMMSYEFPLAAVIVTVAWKLNAALGPILQVEGLKVFSLSTIAAYPVWSLVGFVGGMGMFICLAVMLIVTPAELSKVPFDAPDAHEELSGGVLVEYSGRNLALYYLMEAAKTVAVTSLTVAIFFPYGIAGLFGVTGLAATVLDFGFFWVKVFIVMLVAVTFIRTAIARFKIDQIAHVFWAPVLALSLTGLLLVAVDHFLLFM